MSFGGWREVTTNVSGDSAEYGCNDIKLISQLFNGVNVPAVKIASNNGFYFLDSALRFRDPLDNLTLTIRTPAISSALQLSIPVIIVDDIFATVNLAQTLKAKTLDSTCDVSAAIGSGATPSAHATSHKSGGSDAIKLDEFGATTDITTLNASITAHGLLPKLSNVSTQYLSGIGTWTTPAGGGGAPTTSQYVTLATDATLTAERILAVDDGLSLTDGGAGNPVTIARDVLDIGRKRVQFVDDFFGNTGGVSGNFGAGISGTGAAVNTVAVSTTGVFGVWSLETGTTTTGKGAIVAGNLSSFSLGQGQVTLEGYVIIPTLSTAGEEFDFLFGLGDSFTGFPTDGVIFYYDRNASTEWRIENCSNGVFTGTVQNTGTTVTAGSWIRLKIVVNAAGTSVSFYINGTQTSNSPMTTNIPTGAGRELTIFSGIIKSAGTTNRTAQIDYVAFDYDLTTPR